MPPASPALEPPQLAALFDAVPTPVVATAASSGEVVAASRAFCDLVALPEDDVLGARPPYPWTAGDRAAAGLAEGRTSLRRPDGTAVAVQVDLRPALGAGGETVAQVCSVTDLSAPRGVDEQLLLSGRLAAVGELAAGVAHEVNNPLFAILGLTEFLAKEAEPGSKAAERLDLIRASGEEIREIVRALLDFARERVDEREVVSLAQVARRTVTLVRRTNADKGIELVPSYDESDPRVLGSPNQLEQVFLNLITNARQAMTSGGTVWIDVRREGDRAVATVSDDGPGVPAELAGRIFEPFFTSKGPNAGTGLGLSVSLGIAESHGGTLSLDRSRPGGAAFVLSLPLAGDDDA